MNYRCPHCNKPAISVFKRFWLRKYMRFNCKSCGTQLRIHRDYLRRGAIGILLVWFVVTLAASYFPFSSYVRVAVYIVTLFAAISIFNLFVPFEEVEQEVEKEIKQPVELEVEEEEDPEIEQVEDAETEQGKDPEIGQEEEQKNNL